jgi:hypothetical protein
VKHQLSKSAEPPRGGEAQKALLTEGRRRVPPPAGQAPGVKHQLSKSAEPPRGGEAQKALLTEGRRRVPPQDRNLGDWV